MYSYMDYFFFFSSRRRHTRSLRDWSSDVCSSDLPVRVARGWGEQGRVGAQAEVAAGQVAQVGIDRHQVRAGDGRSEERRVGKSVDLGGRRIIKKKRANGQRGSWVDQYNE